MAFTVIQAGPEQRVNTYTPNSQSGSTIASLPGGGWVVTWMSVGQDGFSVGIYQQRYNPDGTPVGGEIQVNSFVPNSQETPTIAALNGGGWVVTWTSFGQPKPDNSGYETDTSIFQQRYDAQGNTVGGETRVNSTITGPQLESSVTALADGGWVVTWQSLVGGRFQIFQQRYQADGSLLGGETRVDQNLGALSAAETSVAALADGGWVVTWTADRHPTQDSEGRSVFQQRYASNGTPAGTETRVNTTVADSQSFSEVTALSDGGWVVTWTSNGQDGSGPGIYQQRYHSNGTAIGTETRVNTTTTDAQANPSVTAMEDGGWVVSWQSLNQDGSGTGIYQQRYDSNGSVVGVEMRANATTANDQFSSKLTALEDGRWVVTWTSFVDGTFDVFQRTFELSTTSVLTGSVEVATGTDADETLMVDPGGLNTGDVIDARGGRDTLAMNAAGALDLRMGSLTAFEVLHGSTGDDTIIVNSDRLAQFSVINGKAGTNVLELRGNGEVFDFSEKAIFNISSIKFGPTGNTRVVLADKALAFILEGTASDGERVKLATGTFTAEEKAGIFAKNVDIIEDESGVYTNPGAPPSAPTFTQQGAVEATRAENLDFSSTLYSTDDHTPANQITFVFDTEANGGGGANGLFVIDTANGQLKLNPDRSLNFEDLPEGRDAFTVYVKAFDGTFYSATQALRIKVTDVNEAPTSVSFGGQQNTIRVGTTGEGVVLVQTTAIDPDRVEGFKNNTYKFLVNGQLTSTHGGFSINAQGLITTNDAFGSEVAGSRTLMVVAHDANSPALRLDQATAYTFDIVPQDAPPVVQFAAESVMKTVTEGTGTGTTEVTFKITRDSANGGDSTVRWTLTHGATDASDFSGVLTDTVTFSNGAIETFVRVQINRDSSDESNEETFTVGLEGVTNSVVNGNGTASGKILDDDTTAPVNNPPSIPVLSGDKADEYAAAGTVVGTLSATDLDAGDVLSYTLLGNADGRFKLAGNQILVADGFRLDYEQAASHTVKVQVKDRAGATSEQSFVIKVNDINPESTAGSAANDVFKGGAAGDTLGGGLGHDVLGGGAGKDKLYGGKTSASKDAFLFDVKLTSKGVANQHKDQILDFGPKYDSIWFDDAAFTNKAIVRYLTGKGASLDKPVKMKAGFFKVGDKAADKDDFFIYNARSKKLYWDVDGSGKAAMVEIASLKLQKNEGTALTHKDFFFV